MYTQVNKQVRVHVFRKTRISYTGCTDTRDRQLLVKCTCCIKATSSLNCDLVAKNVYFSTQECVCSIFLTQKLCLYLNTLKGLRVTDLLFRGFSA